MSALVIRADAGRLPLPDNSVDLVVTSPPYFGLRSYTDGGEHYAGQIGAERTPGEYIAALIACTREWMRVLKPSGSVFVNLGDSYYSGKGAPGRATLDAKNAGRDARRSGEPSPLDRSDLGYPRKSLLLLPERYRIACLDDLGLTVRQTLIWAKGNAMPESVRDRCRRSHEDWVHLTKGPKYFSAVDALRRPHSSKVTDKGANCLAGQRMMKPSGPNSGAFNPLGALPGSVWDIATDPLRLPPELGVDHYAAFPMEWPRRLILGWSPERVCTRCGEGRRPVTERTRQPDRPGRVQGRAVDALLGGHGPDGRAGSRYSTAATITGSECACPDATAPFQPGVVLDPFGGTGTTATVASALGRTGISGDMSADYCRVAAWRTTDPAQRAKALGVAAPPAQIEGQDELFDVALAGGAR